jgi:hypothetical protein
LSGKPDALSRRPDYQLHAGDELHKGNFLQLFQKVELYALDATVMLASDLDWLTLIRTETLDSELLVDFQDNKLDSSYVLRDHILYRDDLIVLVSELLQLEAFRRRHCSALAGHFGVAKTVELLSRDYWFPRMRRVVQRFIANCDLCQRAKPQRHAPYGLLMPLQVPDHPWQAISMDWITDLPISSGFDTLLVFKCRLTKMAHFVPVLKTDTSEITVDSFLKNVVRLHGVPTSIVSDRDPRLTAGYWRRFMELLNTKVNLSSAFHPQTDGSTEVINQVIEQYLRVFCSYQQDDWVSLLSSCEFAYNNSINTSTGMTPFFACTGRHPLFDLSAVRAASSVVPSAEAHAALMETVNSDL